jgi:hypothetical protein
MTNRSELIFFSNYIEENDESASLHADKKELNKSYILIDEFKLLDYKSDVESKKSVKDKNQQTEETLIKSSKIIILTIFTSSVIQSIFFVFILPTKFTWPDHVLVFFLVFGWCMFFNSIFFESGVIKKVSNYLNVALTDYDNLGV